MKRIAIALLLLICLPPAAEALPARRPVLRIYFARWCEPCKLLERDLKAGGPEVDALLARFDIQIVDIDRQLNAAIAKAIRGIEKIPAFQVGGVVHYGYRGLPDLLQRLGIAAVVPRPDPKFSPQQPEPLPGPPAIRPTVPAAAEPPAARPTPPEPADQVTREELAAMLERVGDGIEERLALQVNGVRASLERNQAKSAEQTAAALKQVEAELNLLRSIEPPECPDLSHVEQQVTEHRSMLQELTSRVGAVVSHVSAARTATGAAWSWWRVGEVALGSSPAGLAALAGIWLLRRRLGRGKSPPAEPPAGGPAPRADNPTGGTAEGSASSRRDLEEELRIVLDRLRRKGGEADAAMPPDLPEIPPRCTEELHQLLQLRRLEGRDPLLDATFGMFVEDELRKLLGDESLDQATRQSMSELLRRVRERVDAAAPLSIQPGDV